MSREIDERIVSMQFENRNFEKNANQSMSTLDKLKEKLNFKAAAKGVDNLEAAVKKVDFSSMGKSVDNVGLRFNAMYTIADQTFRNIVNSAELAAKRMFAAFTTDPIKTGLSEYETKINAIQVIQSNTRGKNTMDDITTALDELNTYADKTIYNFAQMTNNIGKFVAQGLDVQKATNAVQGMANLAAASGASAEDMARATYQMSQALGGVIRKIDWNSLRNANMATVDLKNTLTDLAKVKGINIDAMIKKKGTFEDTLELGWLTGDMFTEAMNIYSGVYSEAELASKGFTEDQIKNFMDLAASAASAATEVKTFSQLFDVLKETTQSGWTQTWEEIIGDFDSAKESLTQVQKYFSNLIDTMSDARNFVVKHALNFAAPWEALKAKLDASGIGQIVDKVADYTDKLQYFQDIMHSVWMGNYKNADTGRYGLLDAAGYDHRVVQELVNISDKHYKSQGWKYQLTVDDIRAAHEKYGVALDENSLSLKKTDEATGDLASALEKLSDKQLKQMGFTEDEIKILRELQRESKRTGKPIESIAEEMSKFQGRDLLIDSLKNAWSGLFSILKAVGGAWTEIFPPIGFVQLYNAITGIHNFSEKLVMSEETADNLKRTFKGLFAILDIVTTLVGGGFKIAFKAVKALLGLFNIDILEFTAMVGDALVALRDWMDSLLDFEKIFKGLGVFFKNSWKAIKNWIKGLKETDDIPKYIIDSFVNGFNKGVGAVSSSVFNFGKKIITKLEDIFGIDFSAMFAKVTPLLSKAVDKFKEWFGVLKNTESFGLVASMFKTMASSIKTWLDGLKNVKGAKDIAKYIISGLVNGLQEGIKLVGSTILELGKKIFTTICEYLGIHSPSTVFFAIGGFIIAGLVGGLLAGGTDVWNTMKDIASGCVEALKGVDWGALLGLGIIVSFLVIANKITNVAKTFADGIHSINGVMDSFSGTMKAVKNGINAFAIKTIATSVAILAAAIAGLSLLDVGKAWSAVGMIVVIIGLLVGSLILIDKLGKDGEKTVGQFTLLVASIGGAMLLLAITATIMSKINPNGFANMGKVLLSFVLVIAAFAMITKIATNSELSTLGKTLMSMAGTIAILALVVKAMSGMQPDAIENGLSVVFALTLVIFALVGITKIATNKELELLGKTLMSMAGTMAILALVMKMMSGMSPDEMKTAIDGIAALVAVIFCLTLITKFTSDKEMKNLGTTLLSMAGSIAILALIAIILGKVNPATFETGMQAIVKIVALIMVLVAITWLTSEKEMANLGKTLMSMAGAIAVLSIVAVILGLVKPETLNQGLSAIIILSLCMAVLVASTKGATDCMKNLIVLAAAIAILGGLLIALSCMDPFGVAVGTIALAALMGVFALLIKMSSKASGSLAVLITLTVAIGILGGVLIALSCLPYQNTIGAAIALSALMLAMMGVLFLLDKMNVKLGNALKGIIGLSLMAIPLRLFVGVLSSMQNVKNALSNAAVLSGLALAMTLLLIPLTIIGNFASKAIGGVIALALMAVPLIAFVGVLACMQNVKNAADSTVSLTNIAIAMTLLLIPLTIIGNFAAQAILGAIALTAMAIPLLAFVGILALMQNITVATDNVTALVNMAAVLTLLLIPLTVVGLFAVQALLGVVALTAMAIPLLAFVGILALMQNIEGATANTMLIVTLMTAMTDCLVKIALVAPLALIAVVAVTALLGVITAFGVLVTAIGALNELSGGKLEEFINTGIPLMIKMAEGLGQMIGKFITALAGEVMKLLPMLGMSLSTFMINATPFIMGAKLVDKKVLDGVGILAASVLALTVADVINAVASFFTGGFAELGTELSNFIINATPFIMGARLLNTEVMTGVKALAETVLILTAADVLDGLTSWFTGGNSFADFANQLPVLGSGIRDFMDEIGTFTTAEVATVTCAAEAVKILAEAANEIPNTGGLLGDLVGNNDLGPFAEQFPKLGEGIRGFLLALGGGTEIGAFTTDQQNTLKSAAETVKTLAKAANEIPNAGGKIAEWLGDNKLDSFAAQFPVLAGGIRGFLLTLGGGTELGSFTTDQQNTLKSAASAVTTLAKAANEIPNAGGKIAEWLGDNDLGTFASHFPKLGTAIRGFVDNIGEFTYTEFRTIECAVDAVNSLAKVQNMDTKKVSNKLEELGPLMNTFASNVVSFKATMEKISTKSLTESVGKISHLVTLLKQAVDVDADSIRSFGESLKSIATSAVKDFAGIFSDYSTQLTVKSAVLTMLSTVTVAIQDAKDSIVSAFETNVTAASDAIESEDIVSGFTSAGEDLGNGLITGINNKGDAVYWAAYALGQKAVAGEKAGQQSNSPSKLTYKAGKWLGEGLVNGMVKMTSAVYGAGYDLGETATNTISSAVNRISAALNSDIDSQPTITPVLDLSNVTAGANAISGLFSGRRTLTVDTGAVGIVAASMANRQNGSSTADVVSSIKALRKDLANMPRESININGITYDDGSNIADAVHTLIRAAKIEGRV